MNMTCMELIFGMELEAAWNQSSGCKRFSSEQCIASANGWARRKCSFQRLGCISYHDWAKGGTCVLRIDPVQRHLGFLGLRQP